MKTNLIVMLALLMIFTACDVKKDIEFQGVKNVSIVEKNRDNIKFLIHLEFYNPNIVGGSFEAKDLDFYINDLKLSQMRSDIFEVPAKENFIMPVLATIDHKALKENQISIITTVLSLALTSEVELHIQGDLDYKILGYSSHYPIEYSEKVKLKKK